MSDLSSDCCISAQCSSADNKICRDFLRNVCNRGRRCKYVHPPQMECEKLRRSERIFCHDFQNSVCRRPACKFLHYSRDDEESFRLTGYLPNEHSPAIDTSTPSVVEEMPPICKDYLNSLCSRGANCKYRHLSVNMEKRTKQSLFPENTAPTRDDRCTEDGSKLERTQMSFSGPSTHGQYCMGSSISLRHSTLPDLSSSVHCADRSMPHPQPTTVVSVQESLLTPVKEVYISTSAPATPVVGVVDRVAVPSSSLHPHTLYAHPSGLGAFAPLVSVSSTSQPVPCSSVLTVVQEPSQHPTVLQHPNAVATSQTTYHLLSNNPTHMQPQHILSSTASASSQPTLLTIPLPQFTRETTTAGTILTPQASVVCTTHQPATVLTNVLPSNSSSACYPPYNLVQLSTSSTMETLPVFATEKVSTATVPSSSVLAAAAAAGYLAHHLPVMAGNCSTASHVTASENHRNVCYTSREDDCCKSGSLAANLPVAAAAALAAAKALTANSQGMTTERSVLSTKNMQHEPTHTRANAPYMSVSTTSDEGYVKFVMAHHSYQSCPASTTTTTATTITPSTDESDSSDRLGNSLDYPSSNTHFVLRKQHEDEAEHANAAAAVAAAACIGAMFSHPLGDGSRNSTSMAAMLGDLMHSKPRNVKSNPMNTHQCLTENIHISQQQQRQHHQQASEMIRSSQTLSDDYPVSTRANPDNFVSSAPNHSYPLDRSMQMGVAEKDTDRRGMISRQANDSLNVNASGFDDEQTMNMKLSNPTKWSDVTTSMASAAHAAAAAAVAATAAVTRSAKYFQLNRKQGAPGNKSGGSNNSGGVGGGMVELTEASAHQMSNALPMMSGCGVEMMRKDSSTLSNDRTTLSPNTAATMTNAAAAVAMVAAAEVKQRRLYSEMRHSAYSGNPQLSSNPSRTVAPSSSFYYPEDMGYPVSCERKRYCKAKRRLNTARYDYSRRRRAVDDDDEDDDDEDDYEEDDEEETDVFGDDTDVTMPMSPNIPRPYGGALKMKKNTDSRKLPYALPMDESRTASCDTSPSDAFEIDSYTTCPTTRSCGISSFVSSSSTQTPVATPVQIDSWSRARGTTSIPVYSVSCCGVNSYPTARLPQISSARLTTATTTVSNTPVSSFDIYRKKYFSVLKDSNILRRSRSTGAIAHYTNNKLPVMRRSKSNSSHVPVSDPIELRQERFLPLRETNVCTTSASSHRNPWKRLPSTMVETQSSRVDEGSTSGRTINTPQHRKLPIRTIHEARKLSSRSLHMRTTQPVKKLSGKRRPEIRPPTSTSPDSVMTEDFGSHDDVDDAELVDMEDYEDELFGSALKRSRTSGSKMPKSKPLSNDPYGTRTLPTYPSASMRQQQALKAENVRLRRKLSDLLRQRGDLRAANEILLEQNARLRHSSKRASVVARMAESATKIIEAHNQSHNFVPQSVSQPVATPMYRTSVPQASQSSNQFSLTQAAAAVVAAAQHQPNAHALRGVYVSSPSVSTTQHQQQQAPQAVAAAVAGGTHTIFPSGMVASAVPGSITLSSHQPLTAVQLQTEPIVPTSVSGQTVESAQNYYQHQIHHSVSSLPVSIASLQTHPNLAPASSTIQVCHYPIVSTGGPVYPSLAQPTAVTPSMVHPMVGTPNAVTLLVSQPPPSAYASVGSHLPTALHLQNSVKSEHTPVNMPPVSPLPFLYPGSPSSVMSIGARCLPTSSIAHTNTYSTSSTGAVIAPR